MLLGSPLGAGNTPGGAAPVALLLPWTAFLFGFTLSEARWPLFAQRKQRTWTTCIVWALAAATLVWGNTFLAPFGPANQVDFGRVALGWLLLGCVAGWNAPSKGPRTSVTFVLGTIGAAAGLALPHLAVLIFGAVCLSQNSDGTDSVQKAGLTPWIATTGTAAATWVGAGIWIQSRPALDPSAWGLGISAFSFLAIGLLLPFPKAFSSYRGLLTGAFLLLSMVAFGVSPRLQSMVLQPDTAIENRLSVLSAVLMLGPGLILRLFLHTGLDRRFAVAGMGTGLLLAMVAPLSLMAQILCLVGIAGLTCVLFSTSLLYRFGGVALMAAALWTSLHSDPGRLAGISASWQQDALKLGTITHLKSPQTAARRSTALQARRLLQSSATASGSFALLETRSGQVELELDGILHQNESRSADTQRMLPHLGAALHPAPLRAIVLGDPLGLITEGLVAQEIDRIQVTVPMPEALRAVSRADSNVPNTLLSATVQLTEGSPDTLLAGGLKSDLLIEMAHTPWTDAFQGLPKKKALSQRREALGSEGVYVLGLDLYWVSEAVLRALLDDFVSTFEDAWAFLPPQGADQLVLVGRTTPAPPSWNRFVMASQGAAAALGRLNIRSPLDLADRVLSGPNGLSKLRSRSRSLELPKVQDLSGSPRLLLPLFRPHLADDNLFSDQPDVVAALAPRREAVAAFLTLLESNEQGKMDEVFRTSRELAQLDSGDRSLDPLISPYLDNARKALEVARSQGGVTTALDRAQTELSAALLLNPNSAPAHALMGEVQLLQGRLSAANESFQKALRILPGSRDPLLGLASIAIQRKDYPSAETHLREVVVANPKDWLANYNLGTFLFERGLTDEAEETLRKAIKLNEGRQSAPNTALAQLYLSRGEATAALMEAHRAIGIEKNAMNAYVLGKAYFEVEQTDSAAQYFQRAILADPSFWQARAGMGLIFVESGEWKRCIESFQKVLEIEPGNEAAMQNLAHCESQN